jgi:hypothetical protein
MKDKPPEQNEGSEVPFWTPGHPWLHETMGNNDRAWHGWVELLTEAARKVYDGTKAQLPDGTEFHLAINSVAAMLTGYAIECALKGLWVKAGNKVVMNGRYARIPNAGDHALDQLARAVGKCIVLPVTEEELSVLERLSAFVIFAGRYPIPLTPERMAPVKSLSGGAQVPHVFTPEDFQVANHLLNRFTTALNPFLNLPLQKLEERCE